MTDIDERLAKAARALNDVPGAREIGAELAKAAAELGERIAIERRRVDKITIVLEYPVAPGEDAETAFQKLDVPAVVLSLSHLARLMRVHVIGANREGTTGKVEFMFEKDMLDGKN